MYGFLNSMQEGDLMKTERLVALRTSIRSLALAIAIALPGLASAQQGTQGGWAAQNDPLAKLLVAQERIWAMLDCTPSNAVDAATEAFVHRFIADDFVGTSPRGALYTKADMLANKAGPKAAPQQGCKLIGAKVRFVRPDTAIIYGRESASIMGSTGTYATRTLVWTDTLLKRNGKWQIVAVQDMPVPSK